MSNLKKAITLTGLLFLGLLNLAAADTPPAFEIKDGDCIVFYGDSITDQRLYTTFTETYIVTRFPNWNVRFVHSGWSGDRVGGGGGGPVDVRLQRDVIAYKPTLVTIMLGMNDGNVAPYNQSTFDNYARGYEHIVNELKKALPGLRMTLIEPSPYDDVTRPPGFEGGYNATLIRFGQFIRELAQRENVGVADLNASVVEATTKAFGANPELAKTINPDRVHPSEAGHLLMAAALLDAWNAPDIVTSVEIDAAGAKVLHAQSTAVTGLETDGSIRWAQLDAALPLPINMNDPATALAVNSSDVIERLNQQILKFTGLPASNYVLKIDQDEIGTFTREQLETGINLAMLPTPMFKQAMAVHDLTIRHNNMHYFAWRNIQVPVASGGFQSSATQDAAASLIDAINAEEAELINQQRAAAQPVQHQYELSPITP